MVNYLYDISAHKSKIRWFCRSESGLLLNGGAPFDIMEEVL